jgi:pimeloyl-ACP methyl ester carboxylesterase
LYQHNRDYMRYLRDNLAAYGKYCFPVILVQGTHDIAMPPGRFDGSTGMAVKRVRRRRWRRTSAAEWIVLSRPFSADGQGLGNGYVPWGELIPGCTRPMPAAAFFPDAPDVALRFVDAGHFLPLEAPEAINRLLDELLAKRGPDQDRMI